MLIHLCPVCVRRNAFRPDQAGKRVECPRCGAHDQLPRPTVLDTDTKKLPILPRSERSKHPPA